MRINPIQGQQIHQAQPVRTSAALDLVTGGVLALMTKALTPEAKATKAETQRAGNRSLHMAS